MELGWVVVSSIGTQFYVVARCVRCAQADHVLPPSIRAKRQRRAFERAVSNPSKFLCAVFVDKGPASLAKALMANSQYTQNTMAALGWMRAPAEFQP